jgi:hypothetical protein
LDETNSCVDTPTLLSLFASRGNFGMMRRSLPSTMTTMPRSIC